MSDELLAQHEVRTTDRSIRDALIRLRSAQKPGTGAPPYSRWINRRLGRVFAAVAYRVGLTPNAVTAISALFTFTGLALIALLPPEPWDGETWAAWTAAVKAATGRKGRDLFMPLRLALTGLDHGPDMASLLPLIGHDRALKLLAGETA